MEVKPALDPTQPPIQLMEGSLSPRVKRPGREADSSPPFDAQVNSEWRYTFVFLYAFMSRVKTSPFILSMTSLSQTHPQPTHCQPPPNTKFLPRIKTSEFYLSSFYITHSRMCLIDIINCICDCIKKKIRGTRHCKLIHVT